MDGDRSQKIYGRIHRVLTKSKGLEENRFLREEILDEMNEGQKQIFLRAKVEVEKTIYLSTGETDYTLIDSDREIYGSISRFICPSTWLYPLDFIYPNDWNDIVNGGQYDTFTNPVKATIFANKLKLYPAPQADEDLIAHALMKMPTTDLSTDVDPETPEDYDAAVGDWALWKLLGDSTYFTSFMEQVNIVKDAGAYKGYNIQKSRTW